MAAMGGSSGVLKSTCSTYVSIIGNCNNINNNNNNNNANKLSGVSSSVSPWRVSVRNRRQFDGIRCRTASFSIPSLPTPIEFPEIKFYPSEDQTLLLNEEDEKGRTLKKIVIRMSIRDEDGFLAAKLAPYWLAFLKMPTGMNFCLHETTQTLTYLSHGVSGCLLEHVDSWICGYSLVTYKDFGVEFNKELSEKLEPIVNFFVGKEKTVASKVRTVELFLRVGVYGKIFDRDIRTRDDLIDVLEQLNTCKLESKEEDLLLKFVPLFVCGQFSKTELDQFNGYAHLCLGKFQ